MAEFNPQIPDPSNPDRDKGYIGYSEGFRPVPVQQAAPAKQFSQHVDRSAEIRAKGKSIFQDSLSKLFGPVIEATDQTVKTYIENTLTDKTNAIRDEYGVGAMAVQNTEAGGEVIGRPPLPAQLETSGKEVEGLTAAYQSGRLKDSQYWARLESMVRQMKTRFPGYRGEIDSMVSKLTGATPANVLRELIQREALDAAKASNETFKNEREYIESIVNSGEFNHIFGANRDPETVSYHEALIGVKNYRATKAGFEARAAELKARQEERAENVTVAVEQFSEDALTKIFPATREKILKDQGFDGWAGFQKFLTEVSLNPTPENQRRAEIAFRNLEIGVESALLQHKRDFYSGQGESPVITDEQANTAVNTVRAEMTAFRQYLTNKDYGTASANARMIEAMSSEAGRKLMDSNTFMRSKVGIEQSLGKDYATEFVTATPNAQAHINDAYAYYYSNRILAGDGNLSSFLTEAQQKKLNITSKEFNQVMDQTLTAITSPTTNADQKAKAAKILFSKENRDLIGSLSDGKVNSDPALPAAVFAKYTAPEVRDAMLAIRERHPEAFAAYKNYVTASFQTVMKQEIDNLNHVIQFNDDMDINYDPKADKLEVKVFPRGPTTWEESQQERGIQAAVERFNIKLAQIKPIYEAGQTSGAKVMRNFLDEAGFDLSSEGRRLVKQGSFGHRLWQVLRQTLADTEITRLQRGSPRPGEQGAVKLQDGGTSNTVSPVGTDFGG
jgi:hypothetical protein